MTAAGIYIEIVIKPTYSKGTGRVWFDELNLSRSP